MKAQSDRLLTYLHLPYYFSFYSFRLFQKKYMQGIFYKERIAVLILAICTGIFFYKTILFGLMPFPGDLLQAEYKPWQSYAFQGYSAGGIPHKAQYFDAIRQIYPWKTFSIEQIKKGGFPLWNPYNFSGYPLYKPGVYSA